MKAYAKRKLKAELQLIDYTDCYVGVVNNAVDDQNGELVDALEKYRRGAFLRLLCQRQSGYCS